MYSISFHKFIINKPFVINIIRISRCNVCRTQYRMFQIHTGICDNDTEKEAKQYRPIKPPERIT